MLAWLLSSRRGKWQLLVLRESDGYHQAWVIRAGAGGREELLRLVSNLVDHRPIRTKGLEVNQGFLWENLVPRKVLDGELGQLGRHQVRYDQD